jgi:hypothetical protein
MEATLIDMRPVHTMTYGTVRITISCDRTPLGVVYTITPMSCRNPDAQHDSHSFVVFDLPVLAQAALAAHSWILAHRVSQEDAIRLPALTRDGQDEQRESAATEDDGE